MSEVLNELHRNNVHRMIATRCNRRAKLAGLALLLLVQNPGRFQTAAAVRQRETNTPRVYKMQITPHWFDNGTKFWYRNDLPNGAREFILVDAENGRRSPAFDHAAVARQLGHKISPLHLPVEFLVFDTTNNLIHLVGLTNRWIFHIPTGLVKPATNSSDYLGPNTLRPTTRLGPTTRTGQETSITFVNKLPTEVTIWWIDTEGDKKAYAKIEPGQVFVQHTYGGHKWLVTDPSGRQICAFEATDYPSTAIITTNPAVQGPTTNRRPRNSRDQGWPSPDNRWTAKIERYNVWVYDQENKPIQLTTDGDPTNYYAHIEWSPDSTRLVAWRVEPGHSNEVYLIHSSPPAGGRAKLERRVYSLPGDKFPRYELNIICITNRDHIKPNVDKFEHEWDRPEIHWEKDGRRFTWWQVDRGHQRARIFEVDSHTGAVRTLFEERSQTFIWTAHTETLQLKLVNWLTNTDEIIYVSEMNGWRHLYLIDIKSGSIQPITSGEWVVRGIDHIDETNRVIWFHASGREPGQDPYFIHYYKVNFDGSNLVRLTDGNGTHVVQFSPNRRFIIDTFSRVDLPPVHCLRRTTDGALICHLERADASELLSSGWRPPITFVAKGRDDKTDIWGVIFLPKNFDPARKYPVVEYIYAGPQGHAVPKSFQSVIRPPRLTEDGFIVVQIDGMGTAHRSKAFHDVCWRNLRDAGFPDRIRWHQAAAKAFPWYDITKGVGIYGASAGGQNAAAALIWHNDFYKVAVAACGCHDNRLDKAAWNEQWMGYMPADQIWNESPTNWYAQNSNIENAHLLKGHLLLIVGELDRNVPPESTLRFADALIRANKDFELVLVPNEGHGFGGSFGERKLREFFIRHLKPHK